jgi:Undecaprenyl-phosphate galactose phosphotransferase WbaP
MEMSGNAGSEADSSAISTVDMQYARKGKGVRLSVCNAGGPGVQAVGEYLQIVHQRMRGAEIFERDLGKINGPHVPQLTLGRGRHVAKRALDLLLIVVFSTPILLLITIIALLLKLESRDPILYRQERIGLGGHRFYTWKFRTMIHDADAVLSKYLEQHSELREEWERCHKLRNDPRVTWLGKLIRRTSLDELPQLWNVLRGEMSLVGPRPIVEQETVRYGDYFGEYLQVLPGITGLWQVSGRNDLSYEQRVALDVYYVRQWSVWMDMQIMAQTVGVVLQGKGAY